MRGSEHEREGKPFMSRLPRPSLTAASSPKMVVRTASSFMVGPTRAWNGSPRLRATQCATVAEEAAVEPKQKIR
jgi:hypothetical protein